MNSKPVLISDMGGVMYSFSSTFNSDEHNQIIENIASKYLASGVEDELEAEYQAVSAWLSNSISDSTLPIFPIPQSAQNLAINAGQFEIVIISTSLAKTSEMILRYAFEVAGIDANIIEGFHIVNMAEFGSKKEPESWEKACEPYGDIRVVVEDNRANLKAAVAALSKRGQNVVESMVMATFQP